MRLGGRTTGVQLRSCPSEEISPQDEAGFTPSMTAKIKICASE
jgi:hypothetical protein